MHALRSLMPNLNIIKCLAILPLRLAIDFSLIITSDLLIINKLDLRVCHGLLGPHETYEEKA